MNNEDKLNRLADAIFEAMEEHAASEPFTTGEAITVLFSIMINTARASPNYSAEAFAKDINDTLSEALGLLETRHAH